MVSAPKAPDPYETAVTQSSMNGDTAIRQHLLNMTNQFTPYGSLTYEQTGNVFTASDTGQEYYYNTKTKQYEDKMREGLKVRKGFFTPTFTATTTLSPEQQKILDQTQGAMLNLGTIANEQSAFLKDYLSKGLDTSGAPAQWAYLGKKFNSDLGPNYSTSVGDGYATSYAGADDFSADRQKYEDALMARQQPALQQNQDRLRSQLINSGLRPGTAAWNSEMARLSQSENDARMSAILAAGDEQARMVGMARDAAQFGNSSILARMQAQNAASMDKRNLENNTILQKANFQNNSRKDWLTEAYAARNQPIQEISALLNGSQISNPNFVNTPQTNVGGVDYTGMVSDKYKADVAAYQSGIGGLFGLLSAPFGMFKFQSDRRLKKDISRIGSASNGLPWYEFRYLSDADDAPLRHGLMSDDVRQMKPSAVSVDERGFDVVDYAIALEAA